MPKVSVIIPTYNRARFIAEAILSVLGQTYRNFEILVVDDGSTDDTKDVLEGFSDKIKYIYQDHTGVASARNAGLRHARGDYIAFIDSDDAWLPPRLQKGVDILESDDATGLVYSDVFRLENNKKTAQTYFDLYPPHRGFVFKDLYFQDFIPTSSVILRRLYFEKSGSFDESLPVCEDHDMWLRLASFCRFEYIDLPLVNYRILAERRAPEIIYLLKMQRQVLRKIDALYPSLVNDFRRKAQTRKAKVSYLICRYLERGGYDAEAVKETRACLKTDFFDWKIYMVLMLAFAKSCVNKLKNMAE